MNKQLKYSGHAANPSDYECADGELAATMDLWPENGAFRPVPRPETIFTLGANQKVVYLHETSGYTHYIIFDSSSRALMWHDGEYSYQLSRVAYVGFRSVTSIGNTLIVLGAGYIRYFLWKSDLNSYAELPWDLPSVPISFGLKGRARSYRIEYGEYPTFVVPEQIPSEKLFAELSPANKEAVTGSVMAKVNKFVKEQVTDKGYFCHPFFIRYALRLYDGSLTKHSAPILMLPSTNGLVRVCIANLAASAATPTPTYYDVRAVAASIDYGLDTERFNTAQRNALKDWRDIVAGIDVFISAPIYGYNVDGLCKRFKNLTSYESDFCGQLYCIRNQSGIPELANEGEIQTDKVRAPCDNLFTLGTALKTYDEWPDHDIDKLFFDVPVDPFWPYTVELPEVDIKDKLASCSTFYKLCTLSIDDICSSDYQATRKDIAVPKDYLQSLVNREVMTDDYLTNDIISAESAYVYNGRLNLSGIERSLFPGFPATSMMCHATSRHIFSFVGDKRKLTLYSGGASDTITIKVMIRENGKEHMVTSVGVGGAWHSFSATGINDYRSFGAYVFYPNVNAFMMRIESTYLEFKYDIELKPHDFLNGAYALLDFQQRRHNNVLRTFDGVESQSVPSPSKLYTSEINNPFYFPVTSIYTVGTGRIIGISSAAKAMSQGQFGQFPLYAFTSEGIWALDVSTETGAFSKVHPITRDIVVRPSSITQLDDSVLFITDRGLMKIAGSQCECVSDIINDGGNDLFRLEQLPHALDIVAGEGSHPEYNFTSFETFLLQCGIIYDYPGQRIILYNSNTATPREYAYVYSRRNGRWSMMRSKIVSSVNSYPEALAMTSDNRLVNYAEHESNSTPTTQMLVTRPLKLDYPDVHKTISHIIQRGNFARGHVQTMLYASNDLQNWFPVSSSTDHYLRGYRGTPYKYFRIVLKCRMTDEEHISGCTVEYDTRMINQPR